MLLSIRKPLYELPPYSLTGDILSFQTCPLQYRYHNLGGLPSSRPVQLWFGQFIHGVLEEAYRRYLADRLCPPPWPASDIEDIAERVRKRLKARGLLARSNRLEELGVQRAERAVNLLGPHLLPLINRVEVRISGARRLIITEGNELVAQLDTLTLQPHAQVTRVYEAPGTKLTVFADALSGGSGTSSVDVLIYGSAD